MLILTVTSVVIIVFFNNHQRIKKKYLQINSRICGSSVVIIELTLFLAFSATLLRTLLLATVSLTHVNKLPANAPVSLVGLSGAINTCGMLSEEETPVVVVGSIVCTLSGKDVGILALSL